MNSSAVSPASRAIGVPVPTDRVPVPSGTHLIARVVIWARDPMTWRELVWLILSFGIGTASFCAGVTGFAIGLGFLTLPAWGWSVPEGVQIGLLTLTFQLTASLLQPLIGTYTDKKPQPFSLVVGMGFTLVGLLTLSQAGYYPMLLLGASLVGMGT